MNPREGPDPTSPGRGGLVAESHGSGPAVVLLHGQPGSSADWRSVVPLLSGDLTVVVPDRPGYGRTRGDAKGFAGNAEAVVDVLDRLQIRRAVITGFSWSGGVALATAETYPDRVSGLVLAASVAPGEPVRWDDRLLGAPVVGEAIAALTFGATGRLLGLHRVQDIIDHRLAGRARDAMAVLSGMTGERAWKSFVSEQRELLSNLDELRPGLSAIRVPTVVINGSSDHVVPPAVGERLVADIPGATRTLVEGAGHLLPLDRPDAVVQAVLDVVRRAAGA